MDIDLSQPMLFDFADTATGAVEFFPEIWAATEGLTSPEVNKRHAALDRLMELDAPRLSPLVAYVLASRIIDPDIEMRHRVVLALGKLLTPNKEGKVTPPLVRQHLKGYYSQMGRRGVTILLEVADKFPGVESEVASILNSCSHMGDLLVEIMKNRKMPLSIRLQAVNFLGRVGYLKSISELERLADRLEARVHGQKSMPFAPIQENEEAKLLPVVQATLAILNEP
jgi:hypothetical protein